MTRTEIIIKRALAGESYGEIAGSFHISRHVVSGIMHRYRKANKEETGEVKPHWTGEQITTLRRMHSEGRPAADIGEQVGKSSEAVRRQGNRMGLSWIGRTRKKKTWHPTGDQSETAVARKQKAADAKLLRALALAFKRGDHLPYSNHPQGRPHSSDVSAHRDPHTLSEAA